MWELEQFIDHHVSTKQAEFLALHPYPFLLVKRLVAATDQSRVFKTQLSIDRQSARSQSPERSSWLYAITKPDDDEPFKMITVGRTQRADIFLDDPGVSKFHAYFMNRSAEGYSVTDAGSANGTTIGRTPLSPHQYRILSEGDTIDFGGVFRGVFYQNVNVFKMIEYAGNIKRKAGHGFPT